MLRELRIENLLLIERAELRLGPGLNVLTGETGAGKTVLAHSLDLLMGGKARKGIVRPGASEAWVEGTFDLPDDWLENPDYGELRERLPSDAGELVIGRRVSASGRTSAFLCGRAAAAADLRLVTSGLLAFYGQHEHRRLTISSAQLDFVDGAGGEAQAERVHRYRAAFAAHRMALAEQERLRGEDRVRERDLDLHRFELAEIEEAAPREGEYEELATERERLAHAGSLSDGAAAAAEALRGDGLEGGASGEVGRAGSALAPLRGVDSALDALIGRVESLSVEIEDVGVELRSYGAGIDADPASLGRVEQRLELLDRLRRKHGGSVAAVLAHAEWCREQIARLESSESRERELGEQVSILAGALADAASALTSGRGEAAADLSGRVTAALGELAMEGASLSIELRPLADGYGPSGAETVEFMLSTNTGIAAQPLRDAASGGELSRVMLALAGTGAAGDGRTLVFDEIDAGIGGNTATAVGDRLREVASRRQVIAITHLAQVASRAADHFTITKDAHAKPASARVEALDGDRVVGEIRRMLGAGAGDEAATRHARELVESGR
jgi:DNA repair protein RecN (Recombination protein N)